MMVARPSRGTQFLFFRILQCLASFYFARIHWPNQKPPTNAPVLLLCNHQSWWDGILIFILHQKFWKKPFYVMMLLSELTKRKFLTYLGAYSIQKNNRSVLESLNYTLKLLENPNHVLVFPQGRLESQHVAHLTFPKGIQYLVNRLPAHAEIWALSVHYSFSLHVRAHCTIYLQPITSRHPEAVDEEWNRFHQQCVELEQQKWQ